MNAIPRVVLAFSSRGIGGAERSMMRLMAHAHPDRLSCRIVLFGRPNPAFEAASAALGVPCRRLPPHGLWEWRRLLLGSQPDLVYVFGRFRTIPWALVARLAGVRCIVAAERSGADRWSDRLARLLDRRAVSAYVANSRYAARNLAKMVGPSGPPIQVVANGIEPGGLPAAEGRAGARPEVVCVANITPNKGQRVLLDAVRILQVRHPDLRAVLVGRDFTRGRFFRKAIAHGLAGTFRSVGFVEDVGPHLARATVLALPTLHREGMPTVLLEAMQVGVPVVASRIGGVEELVEDQVTGLLVEPGDPAALAQALGRVLEDPELASRLAAAGRRRVRERHSTAAMVEGHLRAFRQAEAFESDRRGPRGPARVAHVTTAAVSLRYLLSNQLGAIRSRGYAVTAVSSPGRDAEWLKGRGFSHVSVPMTRRFTPLADVVSFVRLWRRMRAGRFTIVHTHNPKPGLLGQLAARAAGVPIVVNTLHGFYFHERMAPLPRLLYVTAEKVAARCSDVILSQNPEDVTTAIREGIAGPGQIRLLGNGIDLTRFDPRRVRGEARRRVRAELGIDPEAPVVGFVGRLVAEKGIEELMDAAVRVRRRVPGVRFLIVGGSDAEKPDAVTPAAAQRLGLGDTCVFTGLRQDLPELYRAMDVFTLPSHREGFPRAPLEAAAMRLPCVVSDVRGCRQAVLHGRTGLLVPVGDAAALADALVALVEDLALASRLGDAARARALAEFDERRVFATVLGEYERLLAAKGLSRRVPAPEGPDVETALRMASR